MGLVLCYVLGTALGLCSREHYLLFLLGASLCWTAAVAGTLTSSAAGRRAGRHGSLTTIVGVLIVVAVVLAGAVSGSRVTRDGTLLHAVHGEAAVVGVVGADAHVKSVKSGRRLMADVVLDLESLETAEGTLLGNGEELRVRLFGHQRMRVPLYGERWRFGGRIECAPGGRGAVLVADSREAAWRSGGHGRWFPEMCHRARRAAADLLSLGIEEEHTVVGLLRALLLGYRRDLTEEVHDAFAVTGTLHIFAISGLHVGLVAGLIIFVLGAFRVSRVYWIAFLGPLLWAYTVSTGAKPSAVRACIMACVYWLAPLLRRKPDSFTALATAALLILVVAPNQLFEVGFILSFTVVSGLLVIYPLLKKNVADAFRTDPLRVEPERLPIRVARSFGRYVGSLLALSLAAWLASAPLMAYYFGRLAPIALLGNVLVIPLAFLIVLAGALSLVLGACVNFFAVTFNHANVVLASALVHGIRAMSRVPGGSVRVASPPVWAVVAWYALLGVLCALAYRRSRRNIGLGNERAAW